MNLTLEKRTRIVDKVFRLVEIKHCDPGMNGVDWKTLAKSRRAQILACEEPEKFEKGLNRLLGELKTSHTGLRHVGMRNIPARHAINATLHRIAINESEFWMFQDVHEGGPAHLAGIRSGDLLLRYEGREIRPPEDLSFSAGQSAQLTIQKLDGGVSAVSLQLAVPKNKKHPVNAPEAVHAQKLTDEIGLLRVAMFPGVVGIDVARDIDRGISALNGCRRLIVDLRGNTIESLPTREEFGAFLEPLGMEVIAYPDEPKLYLMVAGTWRQAIKLTIAPGRLQWLTGTFFGPDVFVFLRQLKRNNDREWFAKKKARYQTSIVQPALSFIGGFAPQLEKISPFFVADARPTCGSLFRIYRDTRFSPDKRPFKTHVGMYDFSQDLTPRKTSRNPMRPNTHYADSPTPLHYF